MEKEEKVFWGELESDLIGIGGGGHRTKPQAEAMTVGVLTKEIEDLIKREPELMKALALIIFKVNSLSLEAETLRHTNERIRELIKSTEE